MSRHSIIRVACALLLILSSGIVVAGMGVGEHPVGTRQPVPTPALSSERQVYPPLLEATGRSSLAARGANTAYDVAKAGGKHAGLLKNYSGRTAAEIQKAIASLEREAATHAEKRANPARFAERWAQMSAQERTGLIKYWQKEASGYQEQAEVLRGLLGSP